MGFLDKLKNVFFEEEEIEEEEVEVSEKLARKVELPKKKPVVVVEKNEEVRKEVEEYNVNVVNQPKEPIKEQKEEEVPNKFAMMFEEDDFVLEEPVRPVNREITRERVEKRELYPEKKEESYTDSIKKENSYGYTKSYYESKETKSFIPSPIISPIYGILDKNYKKEEVVTRREIKITSNRGKVDLDSVRSKAFGEVEIPSEKKEKSSLEKNEKEEKIYNVNTTKPSVRGVTLEDADEYYNDLGLAYNVDYKDKARENDNKRKGDTLEDNLFDLIESMYEKED